MNIISSIEHKIIMNRSLELTEEQFSLFQRIDRVRRVWNKKKASKI